MSIEVPATSAVALGTTFGSYGLLSGTDVGAAFNTSPGTSNVTSGTSWQYLNNTQIGTANLETHTANQVLHTAGGNYIDEYLVTSAVHYGTVFGLSLTGTDLGASFNTNPGTSAVGTGTTWYYLNNELSGTGDLRTTPITGAQLLYGYVFSVMNSPINNASVSMHIKSIPEIVDSLILTAKDSNTTTNTSGYFEIQAIIGSEIEIIIKDAGMVLYQNTITVTSDTTKDLSTYSLV